MSRATSSAAAPLRWSRAELLERRDKFEPLKWARNRSSRTLEDVFMQPGWVGEREKAPGGDAEGLGWEVLVEQRRRTTRTRSPKKF